MKKFLAILLSLCCFFLVGCKSAVSVGSERQSESSSQIEESISNPQLEPESSSNSEPEPEPEPTERTATLDDFVLISFEQTDNNCLLKFSASDNIYSCILRVCLYEEKPLFLYAWEEYYYLGYIQKNEINEFKFAFYEDEELKGKRFNYIKVEVVQGTIKLN